MSSPGNLRFSAWNLLLLVPFLMLITPLYNSLEPRLFGLPLFYWVQFAFVPVGVVCVAIVYVKTRSPR
jgi:predicted ferric reductase